VPRDKSEACVCCGEPTDGGRDHVPGKQFFPDPRPSDLITVPACERCNEGFKLDEDCVRGILLFGRAGTSAVGRKLGPLSSAEHSRTTAD
jgi:hypothetical protein